MMADRGTSVMTPFVVTRLKAVKPEAATTTMLPRFKSASHKLRSSGSNFLRGCLYPLVCQTVSVNLQTIADIYFNVETTIRNILQVSLSNNFEATVSQPTVPSPLLDACSVFFMERKLLWGCLI